MRAEGICLMAKSCFCGCGRKVPFGRGAQNTSGKRVLEAYEDLKATEAGMRSVQSSEFDDFIAAGAEIVDELRAVVHGDLDPRTVDQRNMRSWLRTAWKALPSARMATAVASLHEPKPSDGDGLTEPAAEVPLNLDKLPEATQGGDDVDEDSDLLDDESWLAASDDEEQEMTDDSRFARYLRKTGGGEWEEWADSVERIEQMLLRTGVPWSRSLTQDTAWTLSADVGDVWLLLTDNATLLSMYQPIHELTKGKDETRYLTSLLVQNFNSVGGACFAVRSDEDGSEHVVVVCRLPARTLDQEELETAMENLFFLSSLFDEPDEQNDDIPF